MHKPLLYRIHRILIEIHMQLGSCEPTAARGPLVSNPGFMSLTHDPDLGKHLSLFNMILPIYNEQAAGAVKSGLQVGHESW